MIRKAYFFTLILVLIGNFCFGQLKSPDEFLPHKIGKQFTPHHMQVDYMYHVAENSPNVQIVQYGTTNEQRPLLLLYISSPENLANLDQIRENNLKKTGMVEGSSDPALNKAIIWMSFSVHGNEAAAAESAIPTVYELANTSNPSYQSFLENTIVIIDPCVNPDGNDRYSHWYRRYAQTYSNPSTASLEHQEPWPGGRSNHYLFDLNRDWAWQTQKESKARMIKYHEWMPHVHCDFHEQGINSPYYFAPAARPYHEYITDWQADFQKEVGKNHAKYFDANNWLYFTNQVFDLLYPSYGDTYPIFNGAIGMTYEQGGSGRAGRAVMMSNGDTLTLEDRVNHHHTVALSSVEVTSVNAAKLIENFEKYFDDNQNNPQGKFKTYIIKGNNPEGRLKRLCELLDRNKIRYGKADKEQQLNVYDYQSGENKRIDVASNDLVISAYQSKGVLVQTLFDPDTEVEDSLTYDITAWSMPFAYGLEAYASEAKMKVKEGYDFNTYQMSIKKGEKPYAYIIEWESLMDAKFVAAVLNEGIKVRYSNVPFTVNGKRYPAGAMIMNSADNRKMGDTFHQKVQALAAELKQPIDATKTGLVEDGVDFGSGNMRLISTPKVAVVGGEGTSSLSFGQVWYFMEQEINYPFDAIPAQRLAGADLSNYNVLVLPEGRFGGQRTTEKLSSWVREGGKLIVLGSAARNFQDQQGFSLKRYASEASKSEAERRDSQSSLEERFEEYGSATRRFISNYNPGSIFKVEVDKTHPLAFGLGDYYWTLKTNSLVYEPLKDAYNVGIIDESTISAGFIGHKLKQQTKNSVSVAVEESGRGEVIYLIDNPLFRAFWENGKFLFSNALFH